MIKKLCTESLEKALNAYLHGDAASSKRLKKAAGKSLKVELLPFNFTFICSVNTNNISLSMNSDEEPTTKIKGTPLQLMGAFLDKNNRQQFFADDLQIEGDAEFAQQIIDLFDHVHIDWEEHMSRWVGDVPAYQVGKVVKNIRNWIKSGRSAFTQDVSDYLHEEAAWFPVREELQDFFCDIDTIRMDVDRLESRVAQLKNEELN